MKEKDDEVAAGDRGRGSAPRDPVTGTPGAETGAGSTRGAYEKNDPDEIQQDIRRTRAEMSETVDELEHRLSPERLKNEAKGAVYETIDEVRYRYNPQRIANRAKRNMLDTIREHPLPALTAGLSIGYMLMKGGGSSRKHDRDDDYGRRAYRPHDYPGHARGMGYESDEYRRARGYSGRSGHEHGEDPSMGERASRAAGDVKRQAHETSEDAKEAVRDTAESVQHGAREAGRRVQETAHRMQEGAEEARHQMEYGARRAGSELEDFVTGNPLAAGAVALGIGALLGGMFPSTRTEDEWMGHTRDEAARRAGQAARETMGQARQSAERVGDRAAVAADEVKETARQEAGEVKETVKDEAKNVQREAGRQAREKST